MDRHVLAEEDWELLEEAKEAAVRLYVAGRHEVAAAVRTREGLVFTGIHIETSVDWADICGEVAAICCMVGAGHRDLDTIAAVWKDPEGAFFLLSPCGRCREVISEFNREAWVVVGCIDHPYKVRVSGLLPLRMWED